MSRCSRDLSIALQNEQLEELPVRIFLRRVLVARYLFNILY